MKSKANFAFFRFTPSFFRAVFAAAVVCVAADQSLPTASAIVLIDDFNFSTVSASNFSVSSNGIGGIEYAANHYGDLGQGTIGNGTDDTGARRVSISGVASALAVSVNQSGNGALGMTMNGANAGSITRIVWDSTALTSAVGGDFDGTSSTLTNIANGFTTARLGGASNGGFLHDATGIWLGGLSSNLASDQILRLGVFVDNANYAFFQVTGAVVNAAIGTNTPTDVYLPFFAAIGSGNTLVPDGGFTQVGSTPLLNIFDNARAVVLEVVAGSNGTNGSLSLDSIYAFTPEPATLTLWGAFGAFGIIANYRRKRNAATLVPAA